MNARNSKSPTWDTVQLYQSQENEHNTCTTLAFSSCIVGGIDGKTRPSWVWKLGNLRKEKVHDLRGHQMARRRAVISSADLVHAHCIIILTVGAVLHTHIILMEKKFKLKFRLKLSVWSFGFCVKKYRFTKKMNNLHITKRETSNLTI